MSGRIREHLRSNVVGYIALFCFAFSGTAVALDGANTVFTDDIVNNAVRSEDVRDDTLAGGGLAHRDLGPNSVASSEVVDNSLGAIDLAADSVGTSEVSTDSLLAEDLNTSAVGSDEVAVDSLLQTDLGASSVASSEVATDSLGVSDLAPNSVAASEAATNSIGQSEIATNGVGSAEIADGAIGAAEIGVDAFHDHVGDPVSIPGGAAHNGAYDTAFASADCGPGEALISGSAHWTDGLPDDQEVWIQSIFLSPNVERVTVRGGNDSGTTRNLFAVAHCLAL